jgi:hypothetical protein
MAFRSRGIQRPPRATTLGDELRTQREQFSLNGASGCRAITDGDSRRRRKGPTGRALIVVRVPVIRHRRLVGPRPTGPFLLWR